MEVKLVVFLVVSMLLFVNTQACTILQLNQTKGEITTPGYPHLLDFNSTCYFLKVENGRLKATLQNVSLPDGSEISVNSQDYTVGSPEFQSKVFYSRSKYFLIYVTLRLNNISVTGREYRGVKIVYEKISKDLTVNLQGTTGTLKSPYYPQTYTLTQRSVTYNLEVPDGHVKLNFTELTLSNNDNVRVYDGGFGTSGELLGYYRNKSIHGLPVVVSSGNRLTVVFTALFSSYDKGATFRFLAVFTRETDVTYCKSLKVPNGYAARNLTLQGWKTRYYCNTGYHEKDGNRHWPGVERVCNFNGEWKPGKVPNCLRICQPLSPTLKLNSTLIWFTSSFITYDGQKLIFSCESYLKEILIGPRKITCTSHGNYSALPPTCKKWKEEKSKEGVKSWIIGVGVGGALFICVLVMAALRIFCGCFLCFATSHENGGYNAELDQLEDVEKRNVEETHI